MNDNDIHCEEQNPPIETDPHALALQNEQAMLNMCAPENRSI